MKEALLVIFGYLVRLLYDKISERHPKIIFNVENIRGFNIPPSNPTQTTLQVWQHCLHLVNKGKTPATNLVITHEYLPFNINITPHAVGKMIIDRNTKTITISSVAPKEGIDISYLDYITYPTRTYIVYHEGVAKHTPLLVTLPPKRWLVVSINILAIVGVAVLLYLFWFKLPSLWQVAQALIAKLKAIKP